MREGAARGLGMACAAASARHARGAPRAEGSEYCHTAASARLERSRAFVMSTTSWYVEAMLRRGAGCENENGARRVSARHRHRSRTCKRTGAAWCVARGDAWARAAGEALPSPHSALACAAGPEPENAFGWGHCQCGPAPFILQTVRVSLCVGASSGAIPTDRGRRSGFETFQTNFGVRVCVSAPEA